MRRAVLCMLMIMLMAVSASAEELMIVTGGMLRLREEPDFNAVVLSRYDEGTVVTATETSGAWRLVTAPDGKKGYMYSMYLKRAAEMDMAAARVISGNGGNVNLRKLPHTGAEIIAAVPVGTAVSVLSESGGWRYIILPDGKSGYMMSRYLAAEDSGVRYVTSANGGGVHMRTGPSQQHRSLGVLHVGTQVTLLETGVTWHRIRYGEHEGFMMARYLTAQPQKITENILHSVRISSNTPRVGDVLTAYATPGNAKCLYIWSDEEGRMLGTEQKYQVRDDDAGRRIRVTVTGYGGTTGAAVSGEAAVAVK